MKYEQPSEQTVREILRELMGLEYDGDENGFEGWGLFTVEQETGAKYLVETYEDEISQAEAAINAHIVSALEEMKGGWQDAWLDDNGEIGNRAAVITWPTIDIVIAKYKQVDK